MATAAPTVQPTAITDNRIHLFRLLTLTIDEGTSIVRAIIDDNCIHVPLSVLLANEKTTINRLRASKTITKFQYDLLFPASGTPTTADFDLTLTICLLRNLKTFVLNQNPTWATQPSPTDTSLVADLRRLQMSRNELAHISATTGISEPEFKIKWSDIEQVLTRLNNSLKHPNQNLQQLIDDCKCYPLDPKTKSQLQMEIKKLQNIELYVQEVELRVLELQGCFREVKDEVHGVRYDVHEVKDKYHHVEAKVHEMKDDVHKIQNAVHEVNDDVKIVKGEIQYVKDEASERKGVIHEVKDKIHNVTNEVHELRRGFQYVKDKVYEMKDKVHEVEDGFQEVKDDVHEVKYEFINVKEDFHNLNTQVDEIQNQSEVGAPKKNMFTRLKRRLQMISKKRKLKDDLITLYRQQYHTLPLSPLFEEHDTPLLQLYVMPNINVVESQRSLRGGSEIKSKIKSLDDVFYRENEMYRKIFLLADAGLGKTAFSKRLALTWCQVHKRIEDETKCFEKEEIKTMMTFEFVFLLALRDCSDECDIDQMIWKQIIPHLAHKSQYLYNDIETVLSKEKCLVILDGLDEWTNPHTSCADRQSEIPHRKARECTAILTTARKWKFSTINLKSSQIDRKLELDGLSEMARGQLKKSVMRLLVNTAENTIDDQMKVFNSTVAEKGVSDMESVPLLLMYLLCLWCDGKDIGRSKCVIYCQMLELLLRRTFKRYPEMTNTCPRITSYIPECFAEQVNCKENYEFLSSLGRLAFETLFSETRENTLVFDRSLVDKYLNSAFPELCLRSGIITQDKESKLTSETHKTSFSHKTVHEFFAALYISTRSDQEKVIKTVLSFCNSVKDILEMSQVFVFISGINPQLISPISKKLMKVINEDEMTRTYRSETKPLYLAAKETLKAIQDMYIACVNEIPDNTDYNLCLQDLFFDKACQQESYYTKLQHLAVMNKNNIKSISIEIEGIRSLPEIVTDCHLRKVENCQKIFYRGECKEAELISLLSRPVKCVTILSSEWRDNHFIGKFSSWSPELSKIVKNNNHLQAINISKFNFSHEVLEEFLNYPVKRKSMKEIKLYNLLCTNHGISCPGFNFDLSQHTELRCIGLDDIPLSQLNVNGSVLEECLIGAFLQPGIVKSYLSNISAASKLQIFKCMYLKSSDDIQLMLQILSLLVTVKHVQLCYMNLGESLLPHEIVNIEYVMFGEVTMSSLSLRHLSSWIEKLPQQVTVEMVDCKSTQGRKFERFKKYVRTSKKFIVVHDKKRLDDRYAFKFKTIQ